MMIFVVGFDGSMQSLDALRQAFEHADRWGAEVHAVHVGAPVTGGAEATGATGNDSKATRQQEPRAVWGRARAVLDESRVPVKTVELEGSPAEALVEYCERVGARLLILGTRGRGDLASLVLGSTSRGALQRARCDVLIVKPSR